MTSNDLNNCLETETEADTASDGKQLQKLTKINKWYCYDLTMAIAEKHA